MLTDPAGQRPTLLAAGLAARQRQPLWPLQVPLVPLCACAALAVGGRGLLSEGFKSPSVCVFCVLVVHGARAPLPVRRYLASLHWFSSSHWATPHWATPSLPRFPFCPPTPLVSPCLPTIMDVDHEVKLLREEIMRLGTKDDKGVTRYGW